MSTRLTAIAAFALLLFPEIGIADDSAASVALGGLELRAEPRVAMKQEKLFLSLHRVEVEYVFVNESTEEVSTEVVFPLPKGFPARDFEVEVDGKALAPQAVIEEPARRFDLPGLPGGKTESLAVSQAYHWKLKFKAGQSVRVRHRYTPLVGNDYRGVLAPEPHAPLEAGTASFYQPLTPANVATDGCVDKGTLRSLAKDRPPVVKGGGSLLYRHWIDFILRTALSWKMPIENFELTIERPEGTVISLCWDGKLERTSTNLLRSSVKNFTPGADLRVYFLSWTTSDIPWPDQVLGYPQPNPGR